MAEHPTPRVVLVVEDNRAMRALLRALVESTGAEVVECTSGEAAVDLHARVRPDLVLMDVRLDGMDGLAATRAIRARTPAAAVMVVTDDGSARMREAARAAGADGFCAKGELASLPGLLALVGTSAP